MLSDLLHDFDDFAEEITEKEFLEIESWFWLNKLFEIGEFADSPFVTVP